MIEVDRLTRVFPGRSRPAVDDVSFSVGQGEVVALVGRNGAGKTSLLDVLATLLLPSRGRARVAGHDVEREAPAVRRAVGYGGTEPRGFYTRLTARQNLAFFAALHPGITDVAARIRELADALELHALLDLPVRTCSDGMQQRVVIARALLGSPRVLLLDEPARALDVIAREQVAQVIRDRLSAGSLGAVLYATHDLESLPDACTRMLVMTGGRLVHDGPPDAAIAKRLLAAEGAA